VAGTVRQVSALPVPADLAAGDHLCWTYSDKGALSTALVAFLDEGRRRGEQLLLVGPGSPEDLLDAVGALPDRDELVRTGRLEVRRAWDAYGVCVSDGPEAQVDVLRAATDDAVRRGRTGLRIAADVTELGRDPQTARALRRYEQAVDALFDTAPVTAMCVYDEDLGEAVLGPVAVLHPLRQRVGAETAVHVAVRPSTVRLVGELDLCDADHVRTLLADLRDVGGDDVAVDLTGLAFLDLAGARALAQAVAVFRAAGRRLQVRGAHRNASRCLELVGVATDEEER
jgi:anti-anti-sigma factor